MAVSIEFDLDPSVTVDEYNAVNEAMGTAADMPAGAILHTARMNGDVIHVEDIWDSREQFDQFLQSRLGPAIASVVGDERMQQAGPPEITETELLNVLTA